MNKPDIAKLVADALEAEFGNYRNAELQHITAVNDGPHDQVPLAPLPSLPVPTEGQLAEAFKGQRFDWWRELFSRRVSLAEAAGMLLGFSETMARDSVFMTMDLNEKIAGTNKSKRELPLPLQTRRISSGLVTAFTDMRGDVKDWRATETYRPADLIEWAKEKNFLADEVLAVWKAKAKPQTKKQERRWTPEFLKEVEAYRSTHTEAETAKQFGVSGPLVRRKLKNHKESNKPKPPSPFAGLGKR